MLMSRTDVELALERWAEDYNEQWEKKRNWDEWLRDNQHIPEVKAVLKRRRDPGLKEEK
mgnify:CR=1 FL=1